MILSQEHLDEIKNLSTKELKDELVFCFMNVDDPNLRQKTRDFLQAKLQACRAELNSRKDKN